MNEKKTWKWRIAALYAASAGMSYAAGFLLPLSRGSERSNPVFFTVEFFAPILVLVVLACSFVVFTSLRHDFVALATGIACHLGAVPGPNMFLPITLVGFVGAAFIGAAVGRDIRKMIRRRGQHPVAPYSEPATRSPQG